MAALRPSMAAGKAISSSRPARPSRAPVAPAVVDNRRLIRPATATVSAKSTSNASVSIAASAAASAASFALAKVAAIVSSGHAAQMPGLAFRPTAAAPEASEFMSHPSATMPTAIAPPTASASASAALPAHWLVASSAAQWSDLNRQAATAGVLLATVFVSDKALAVHAPLLERLRRAHSGGARFVFVHMGDDFVARAAAASSAPAATSASRGGDSLATGRMSHLASLYGLDVALAAVLLPDGARGCPALLLTAGPAVDGGAIRWAATTRMGEMTQLLADWAFLNRLALDRKAAAVAAAAAAAAAWAAATAARAAAAARAREAAVQTTRRQAVYVHA